MGLGVSLILIAVGAVLAFAVHATSNVVDVNTVGWIVLIVGVIGAFISLIFWDSVGRRGVSRRTTYYDDSDV